MNRRLYALLLLFTTGCVTYLQRPEAIGVLIDAETAKPISGATVTCPPVARSWNVPQGLPETTVLTSRHGRFHFPANRKSNLLLNFTSNPEIFTYTFRVSADGYGVTNITAQASSNTLWRFDLGRIKLRRQPDRPGNF
jgi:hypothetical protein